MKRTIIICSVILFIILLKIITDPILNNIMVEIYGFNYSGSVSNAKRDKTFVQELTVKPIPLLINNDTIKFNECWIEKTSQIKYKYFLYPSVKIKRPLSYKVCFTLKNPKADQISSKFIFILGGEKYNFAISSLHSKKEAIEVFWYEVESINTKEFKIDVLEYKSWQKLGEFRLEL